MATTTHKAYSAASVAILTTELNSLATATNTAASSVIDNTAALDLYADFELVLAAQGTARSAGAIIALYATYSLDGTNYADVSEATAELVAVFSLDASTTARRIVSRDVPISPGKVKFFARNSTGQTLAATVNTISYRLHSISTTI